MAEPSGGKTPLVKIYGRLGSAEAYQLRDFLHRCDVPFEWIPLESDAPARLPVCEFPDGTRMESPTIRQVTEKLGWFANPSRAEYDLAIALRGDKVLEEIALADRATGQQRSAKTRWLFVCVGGVPQTDWAGEVGVARDEGGYLLTGPDLLRGRQRPASWPLDRDPFYLETSVPGIFAALSTQTLVAIPHCRPHISGTDSRCLKLGAALVVLCAGGIPWN